MSLSIKPSLFIWLLSILLTSLGFGTSTASAQTGEVQLPLQEWESLLSKISKLEEPLAPPVSYAIQSREIDVKFESGLLLGTAKIIVDTFVPDVVVPIIAKDASLLELKVDEQQAVAITEDTYRHSSKSHKRSQPLGTYYGVRLTLPGSHEVIVSFAIGQQQARFTRSFSLRMPSAPISNLMLKLAEKNVQLTIDGSTIINKSESDESTQFLLALDGRETIRATWRQIQTHNEDQKRQLAAKSFALLSLNEDLLRTQTKLNYRVVSGETDRIELGLSADTEVSNVQGHSVLQWYTSTSTTDRRLIILLKHKISDKLSLDITTQTPIEQSNKTAKNATRENNVSPSFLRIIDARFEESIVAVQGRAGYDLKITKLASGEKLDLREVPKTLSELSKTPLLFAFRGKTNWPKLSLKLKKNKELELIKSVIDDLQASSVIIEAGTERTKIKLYIRNNTRQYLRMTLPAGAQLTHALIDGVPFRPASAETQDQLLIPLRQSEQTRGSYITHRVQSGDTLSSISLRYLNSTTRWQEIIRANPHLSGAYDLRIGTTIRIPQTTKGLQFQSSNFVIEVAYQRPAKRFVSYGSTHTELPVLDIPVMSATWHLYLPSAYDPLTFTSNFTQLNYIRYDLIRRVLYFLQSAEIIRSAWAEKAYRNILRSRKAIYKQKQVQQVREALSAFPLVGTRFRFSRVLLGQEQPKISFTYIAKIYIPWIHGIVFSFVILISALLAYRFRVYKRSRTTDPIHLGAPEEPQKISRFYFMLLPLLIPIIGVLYLGNYILGTHKMLVWGSCVGIALICLPGYIFGAYKKYKYPEAWFKNFSFARIIIYLFTMLVVLVISTTYPLLLSSIALFALVVLLVFGREVIHD